METKSKKKAEANGHTDYLSAYGDAPALDDADLDADDLKCGYCSWKPNWLQGCNSPRMLLACVCWFTFTQGQSVAVSACCWPVSAGSPSLKVSLLQSNVYYL